MSEPWDAGLTPAPELRRSVPKGRVLCFAPHPDDEAAGPGGALCMHRGQDDPVRVIVATDGSAGDPDGRYEPEAYRRLRQRESRAGLAVLGVEDVEFWPYPDSARLTESDIEQGAQLAEQALRAFSPDHVYLPWEGEGHPDHHALHVAVTRAMDRAGYRGTAWGYEVWNAMIPDLVLDITAVADAKHEAMLCHQSQTAYVAYDHCMLGLNAYRSLVHNRGRGYCEGYRVLRPADRRARGTAGAP